MIFLSKHRFFWVLTCFGVFVAFGCQRPGSQNIPKLEAALEEIQHGLELLGAVNLDSIDQVNSRISERFKDVDWLTADTKLVFSVDDAMILGDWANARRLMKPGSNRIQALQSEGEVCQTQISSLRKAIHQGATLDGKGEPMDEAYFNAQSNRELSIAQAWTEQTKETLDRLSRGLAFEAGARPSVDSLIRAKRAEWAQQIAATQ